MAGFLGKTGFRLLLAEDNTEEQNMENGMVPAGSPGGALALGQQTGIVAPSMDMMGGGGGFSETWAINKDKHVFVNKKTQEERRELYVIIEEMHPGRVFFPKVGPQKGERVCWSDDGKSSYQGIECTSCPHVSEVDAFNKYYATPERQGQNRPQFVGDCSLRYSLLWTKEFVQQPDGSITLNVRKDRVLLNAPKSSIFAIWSERTGYMKKLREAGHDITKVVTKIKVVQRENADMKSVYDYADFELVGTIESVMPKVARTVEIASEGGGNAPAAAPTAFPSTVGFPATPAPAAAVGFPAASTGFPATAGSAFGAPPAAPAAAPGFPGMTASAPAAPGFPGMTASVPAPAPAAVAPTPAAAPAGPSFQDMAKNKLVQDFAALGEDVKKVVLNVLGVGRIEDVTNEKLIAATQAVASAKGFSAPAAAGVGAPAGNPF